jgi:hypothetical protein
MPYDRTKVDFTDQEHAAAASIDQVIEALADGFQWGDLASVAAVREFIQYAIIDADGDKGEIGSRLISIGAMLERDNRWVADIERIEPPV